MAKLTVRQLGSAGVNADKDPLELADGELRRAQNAIPGTGSSIKKRFGLGPFSEDASASVLGGTTVPLVDQFTGFSILYIGRGGPVS